MQFLFSFLVVIFTFRLSESIMSFLDDRCGHHLVTGLPTTKRDNLPSLSYLNREREVMISSSLFIHDVHSYLVMDSRAILPLHPLGFSLPIFLFQFISFRSSFVCIFAIHLRRSSSSVLSVNGCCGKAGIATTMNLMLIARLGYIRNKQ